MNLKGLTLNLPGIDLRPALTPKSRYHFIDPLYAAAAYPYLHGFGVAKKRRLRIPWRGHETVFFNGGGAISLPTRLPESGNGTGVSKTLRRLYIDSGVGIRFDLSVFGNIAPKKSKSHQEALPFEDTPLDWIRKFWTYRYKIRNLRGQDLQLDCPQAIGRLLDKYSVVSTPKSQKERRDLISLLRPQIIVIYEANRRERGYRVRHERVTPNLDIYLATEQVRLSHWPHPVNTTHIVLDPKVFQCTRPTRRQRFETLRYVRNFSAWLHNDIELAGKIYQLLADDPSLVTPLSNFVNSLRKGFNEHFSFSSTAAPPGVVPREIADVYANRVQQATSMLSRMPVEMGSRQDDYYSMAAMGMKKEKGIYDVFFSYNSEDRAEVEGIAEKLEQKGVRPFLDTKGIRPGTDFRMGLDGQIAAAKSAAIFLGRHGVDYWQNREISALLEQQRSRNIPVIPVKLPGCREVPPLLQGLSDVDYSNPEEGFGRLLYEVEDEH